MMLHPPGAGYVTAGLSAWESREVLAMVTRLSDEEVTARLAQESGNIG